MIVKGFLLLAALSFSVHQTVTGGPIHASCKLTWSFNVNCSFINMSLVKQIQKWHNDPQDCGSGEKCLYSLVSVSSTQIKAKHETPKKHYLDDITFTFSGSSACTVNGYSTSETWYAVLDYGTNYCNMRNLANGAGLSNSVYGFKEVTSDSICTEYSSHNCNKY